MSKATLRIDWCTHEAAKYAVENWHYSKALPSGKLVKVGAWEDGKFIGCVIFGRGANNNAGSPYGLAVTELAELVRVALRGHVTPVSRVMAISIRFLVKQSPGMRLIFSYADPAQGHHGGIYQAGGWVYAGRSCAQRAVVVDGKEVHKRTASAAYGTASPAKIAAMTGKAASWGAETSKHTYLLPLDAAMRAQLAPLAKPYPKRVQDPRVGKSSPVGTTTGEGGALPTPTL